MANDDENPLHRQIMDLFEAGGATEDEDDDIFEPATDQSITTSMLDEDDEDEYEDAEDGLGEVEIVLEQDGEDDEDEEDDDEEEEGGQTETEEAPAAGRRVQQVTLAQLQQLLASRGRLQQLLADGRYRIISYANADDDDDDDDYTPYGGRRRRRPANRPLDPNRFPPVPNENGRVLMNSGVYGTKDSHCERLCRRKTTVSERLLWRRLGYDVRSSALRHNRLIAQEMVPRTGLADKIIHYDSRAYSGQYSDDGNFFFSCTQNFKVQMYDTSNPYEWKYYKTVDFPFGQWTITDATLSPDNKFLAYSSIRHTVCLASTDPDDRNDHTLLDFNNYAPGAIMDDARTGYMGRQGFGIWSLRFSGDGREIVAGTSDHNVLVYDLETRRTTLKLRKHGDDVNAVCFGDKSSPHILFSGSDDQTLRVWDRRSMADGREAGVFVGHTEGLTYVDSKGDGRYVLSNGKDQMMKLWDLRKMVAPSKFDSMDLSRYTTNFDYRFSPYDEQDWIPNPNDCSVVTFRGHRVLKTLIRCHFSPPTSSNSRYVYSGSEDGKVYIWNMDATKKAEIDVGQATRDTRPRSSENGNDWDWDMGYNNNIWKTCVRDASWSPTVPVIAATSWNGWGMSTGTVSMHSWNDGAVDDDGDPPMGSTYDAKLVPRDKPQVRRHWLRSAAGGRAGRAVRSGAVGRAAANDDDEQEGW